VRQLDAEPLLQVDHHQVLHRRRPEGAVVQLGRIGLRRGDELLERLPRAVGAHHDAVHRARELDDVGEVGQRIVGRLLRHQCRAEGAGVDLAQRVAVGPGILQRDAAQRAVRAGLVVGDHLLAEPLAGLLRQHAQEGIGRRAGRPGDHEPDGAVGIVALRPRDSRRCKSRHEHGAAGQGVTHSSSLTGTVPMTALVQPAAVDTLRQDTAREGL